MIKIDKLRKALKNIEDIVRTPFLGKNNYLMCSESFELLKGLIYDYENLQKENEELKGQLETVWVANLKLLDENKELEAENSNMHWRECNCRDGKYCDELLKQNQVLEKALELAIDDDTDISAGTPKARKGYCKFLIDKAKQELGGD